MNFSKTNVTGNAHHHIQVKYLRITITTTLQFFCHPLPITSSSFLEPMGLSHPVIAASDLSPLFLKNLRVKALVPCTPSIILRNEPKLTQNIFTLPTTSHRRESAALKPIFFHCLIHVKRTFFYCLTQAKESSMGLQVRWKNLTFINTFNHATHRN